MNVSPAMVNLDFSPFAAVAGKGKKNQPPAAPEGEELQTLLNDNINMEAMLTLGAVNAFSSNPDELFNHGKNFFWADYSPGTAPADSNGKRMYFPWDLDAAIRSTKSSIYGRKKGKKLNQHPYQEVILNDPVFRAEYNQVMLSLLDGPLSVESLTAFLDDMEPVLTPLLEADPNNQIDGGVAAHFDSRRRWVSDRHANVSQQILDDINAASLQVAAVPEPTTFMLLGVGCLALVWRRRISYRVA